MTIPRPWLLEAKISGLRDALPVDLPPLPNPVEVEMARKVKVGENNEPLVLLPSGLAREHKYLQLESSVMPREMYLRQGVVSRLLAAQENLPDGFSLVLLDTWRTMEAQQELMRLYRQEDPCLKDGYVSDVSDVAVHPPHTTGGAVDITLNYRGTTLRMGTDFDDFNERAHFLAFEQLGAQSSDEDSVVRDLRRLLSFVLLGQGFAPLSNEWWHFSYGDQRWAAHYGLSESVYSTTRPEVG